MSQGSFIFMINIVKQMGNFYVKEEKHTSVWFMGGTPLPVNIQNYIIIVFTYIQKLNFMIFNNFRIITFSIHEKNEIQI